MNTRHPSTHDLAETFGEFGPFLRYFRRLALDHDDLADQEASLEQARAALGAIEYDRAWNAGSALSHDEAIALALDSHVAEKELHVQFGAVEIS